MTIKQKQTGLVVCSIMMALAPGLAQTNEVGSVSWCITAQADRPEAIYKVGEQVHFRITSTGAPDKPVSSNASYVLRLNDYQAVNQGVLVFTNGMARVDYSFEKPSCVLLIITAPYTNRPVLAGAVCEPEKIEPSMPKPDDFDAFWDEQKRRVDVLTNAPVLTPMADFTDDRIETFVFTAENINHTHVRGYFSKPRGGGPFPAYMETLCASVGPLKPATVVAYARRGAMAVAINCHDIENDRPDAFYQDLRDNALKGYGLFGRESRDKSYFLQMFCSCYQTARFIVTRPEWDRKHFIVSGNSQGGGQAFATAYLCPQVSAFVAYMPALCDHTGPEAGRAPGWPRWIAYYKNQADTNHMAASRYFDCVNFAPSIKAKAVVSVGFIDRTCAPSSMLAAYNALKCPKQIIYCPRHGHEGAPEWQQGRLFIQDELGLRK